MRALNTILTGVAFVFVVSGAEATSVRFASSPAEMPPANFKGTQFVDSKGCAYIKAGYSGSVSWVPRAHRNRQVVCGLTPTFRTSVAKAGSVKKTHVRVVATSSAPARTKPRVIAVETRSAAPAGRPSQPMFSGTPASTVYTAYHEKSAAPTADATQATIAVMPRPTVLAVEENTPVGLQKLFTWGHRFKIRRGPQKVHPADAVKQYRRTHGVQVASAPYVLPKGYVSLLSGSAAIRRSGIGTPEGQAAMDLLWTQTMPRRLIDVTTGRDMTASLPQIRYPYTSVTLERMASARLVPRATPPVRAQKTNLKRIKKPSADQASPLNMTALDQISSIQDVSALTTRDTISPVAKQVPSHRFVQVATFGVADNARRTRARFSKNGMPVDTRPTRYKGKKMDIVLLGPFRDQRMLDEAMTQARAAGFNDAFFVN